MGRVAHADDRRRDGRRAARELQGRGRVGRRLGKGRADEGRHPADEPASVERGAREDHGARVAQALEDRPAPAVRAELAREGRPFAHREAVGELDRAQMVLRLTDLERDLEEIDDREMAAVRVGQQEAVPGREPVGPDPASGHRALERLEGPHEGAAEPVDPERAKLDLGLLDQVVVEGREAEIATAPFDLVEQEARGQDVSAVDVLEVDEAGIDVGRVEVALGGGMVPDARAVGRQGAPLRHDDDLLARDLSLGEGAAKGLADRPLARLEPVRERGVHHVAGRLEIVGEGASVEQVVDPARIPAQGAEAEGGEPEGIGSREVVRGDVLSERERTRSGGRGATGDEIGRPSLRRIDGAHGARKLSRAARGDKRRPSGLVRLRILGDRRAPRETRSRRTWTISFRFGANARS